MKALDNSNNVIKTNTEEHKLSVVEQFNQSIREMMDNSENTFLDQNGVPYQQLTIFDV